MRGYFIVPALLATSALAYPASEQTILGDLRLPSFDTFVSKESFKGIANDFLSEADKLILKGKKNMDKWVHDGKQFIKQNGLLCESFILRCTTSVLISKHR